jgi:hypothetical protein
VDQDRNNCAHGRRRRDRRGIGADILFRHRPRSVPRTAALLWPLTLLRYYAPSPYYAPGLYGPPPGAYYGGPPRYPREAMYYRPGRYKTWNGCQAGWTVQDGLCKPYRGY